MLEKSYDPDSVLTLIFESGAFGRQGVHRNSPDMQYRALVLCVDDIIATTWNNRQERSRSLD